MVMAALMRLFPRTTDDHRKESNCCTVDPKHLPVVLLTTEEIVPQIYTHVRNVTNSPTDGLGLYARAPGPNSTPGPFLVYRSSAEDLRGGYAAAYAKWCVGQGNRHAHFMVTTPKAFRDMMLDSRFSIRDACRGLQCILIDEVDALMHPRSSGKNANKGRRGPLTDRHRIHDCLQVLKDIAETM